MVGSIAMTTKFLIRRVSLFLCCGILGVSGQVVAWTPYAFAQDAKGCEGVGFARRPFKEYGPDILRKRLKQNPSDVDALVNLGIYLEEHGQMRQAVDLYNQAIQAKPNCELGYYFAALAEDRLSEQTASDAQAKMHRAVSLDPDLQTDPNVEAFFQWHPRPGGPAASKPTALAPPPNDLLASANHFVMGVGVGLLLAAPLLYAVRRKQVARS
jgi:tetratricopeptide (TPR) repeat protein